MDPIIKLVYELDGGRRYKTLAVFDDIISACRAARKLHGLIFYGKVKPPEDYFTVSVYIVCGFISSVPWYSSMPGMGFNKKPVLDEYQRMYEEWQDTKEAEE